jgi:hypothetical protein
LGNRNKAHKACRFGGIAEKIFYYVNNIEIIHNIVIKERNFALISRRFRGNFALLFRQGCGNRLGDRVGGTATGTAQDKYPGGRKFCRIENIPQKLFEAEKKNFIGRAASAVCKSTTKKVAAAKAGQQL